MKPNTRYSKNGRECCMLPFDGGETISQFAYENFSHAGSTAIDVIQGSIKEAYYAPCTMKCAKIDKQFHFTWWQSVDKVYLPGGVIDYATFMFGHDESINCSIGQVITQGTQVGNMGAGGFATGVHCHIECARGLHNGWVSNAQGVFVLPNATLIENVCFMDDSSFTNVNMNDADFHYTKEIKEEPKAPQQSGEILNSIPSDFIKEKGVFTVTADTNIKIRRAPTTKGQSTGDWYEKGMSLLYDGFVRREGKTWVSYIGKDNTRRWVCVGLNDSSGRNVEPWGTFS